jgi:hypothetical protein
VRACLTHLVNAYEKKLTVDSGQIQHKTWDGQNFKRCSLTFDVINGKFLVNEVTEYYIYLVQSTIFDKLIPLKQHGVLFNELD